MSSTHKNTSVVFSLVLTSALISFTKFSLLPCMLLYLYEVNGSSWAHTVVLYGGLLSSLAFGQIVGHLAKKKYSSNETVLLLSFVFLVSSYIALCFISRYSLMIIIYSLIGVFGTLLTDIYFIIDRNMPKLLFLQTQTEEEVRKNQERTLVCFLFSVLVSGFLYNSNSITRFPLSNMATVVFSVFGVTMVYFVFINRMVLQKRSSLWSMSNLSQSGKTSSFALSRGDMNSDKVHNSGVASAVSLYNGPLPVTFVNVCGGDVDKGRTMYSAMLHWRKSSNVDTILTTRQPGFDDILKYYPHGIHGYSLDNCAVVYEVLGKGQPKELTAHGVTVDMLVRHFLLRNELIFRRALDPAVKMFPDNSAAAAATTTTTNAVIQSSLPLPPSLRETLCSPSEVYNGSSKLMSVLDVGGISLSSVTPDVISFIKQSGEIMDLYYPERVARLVIVNAPRWFFTIWSVIARALPESIQKKVDILYDTKGLDKYIAASQRPVEYGGTGGALGSSAVHQAFVQVAASWDTVQHSSGSASAQHVPFNDRNIEAEPSVGAELHKNPAYSTGTTKNSSNDAVASSARNNGSSSGGGVFKWFRGSSSTNGGGAGGEVTTTPTPAHLGEKNSFKFNSRTGRWEFDAELYEQNSMLLVDTDGDGRSGGGGARKGERGGGYLDSVNEGSGSSSSGGGGGGVHSGDDAAAAATSYFHNTRGDSGGGSGGMGLRNRAAPGAITNVIPGTTAMKTIDSSSGSSLDIFSGSGNNNIYSSSLSSSSSKKMTAAQIEDHSLVLAIQAAHLASSFNKRESAANSTVGGVNSTDASRLASGGSEDVSAAASSSTILSSKLDSSGSSATAASHSLEQLRQQQLQLMSAAVIGGGSMPSSSSYATSSSSAATASYSEGSGMGHGTHSAAAKNVSATTATSESHRTAEKISSSIFLIVTTMYVSMNMIQCALITLLPVWMATARADGGLGYGVNDIGLVMSAAGVVVLQIHFSLGTRFMSAIHASPVRALRAACGVLLVCVLLISVTMRIAAPLEDMQQLMSYGRASIVSGISSGASSRDISMLRGSAAVQYSHQLQQQQHNSNALPNAASVTDTLSSFSPPSLHDGSANGLLQHAAAYWYAETTSASMHPQLPSLSFGSLILPAILFGVLYCSLVVCNRSSSVLLHMALQGSFSSPSTIRLTIGGICDVVGPSIAAGVFAAVQHLTVRAAHRHRRHAEDHGGLVEQQQQPLMSGGGGVTSITSGVVTPWVRHDYLTSHPSAPDATFFLGMCACSIILVYILSIFLRVQFRGDYGVIVDSEGTANNVQDVQISLASSNGNGTDFDSPFGSRQHQQLLFSRSGSDTNSSGSYSGTGSFCGDCWNIPISDISALWPLCWQGAAQSPSYGTKLYNLRDDFKDM